MKAGYIETRLDSESPDVSRKGRQTRAKGAEPLQEGGGRPRNTDAVKRQNAQDLVSAAPAEILAHFSHLSQFEIQKCLKGRLRQ